MDLRVVIFLVVVGTITASPAKTNNPYADKNLCPSDVNVHFLYADPDDCTKYFSCAHGINYLISCPVNLHFSNSSKVCVHPGSVWDTCGQTTSASRSTTTTTTPKTPANPHEAKNKCPQGPTPPSLLYADSDDCSKFFMCSNGVNILMGCPAGLHFNDRLQTCVERGSSPDSSFYGCEIAQAIRKCREGKALLIPHPHVCQRYFDCSTDRSQEYRSPYLPFETECTFPEVFDSLTETCMSHKNATCAGISKPLTWLCDYKYTNCRSSHCASCSVRAPSCVGLADGFHAHSVRINEYVRCEDEYVVEMIRCPVSKIWNDAQKQCVPYRWYKR